MTKVSILLVCAGLFAGCKHDVPIELASARVAYDRAAAGPATQLVPDELHKAQEDLKEAEQAFEDDPKGFHTLDLAYVAQRSSQKADALARIEMEQKTAARADEQFTTTQTAIVKQTKEELAASQAAGAQTSAELASSSAALSVSRPADLYRSNLT